MFTSLMLLKLPLLIFARAVAELRYTLEFSLPRYHGQRWALGCRTSINLPVFTLAFSNTRFCIPLLQHTPVEAIFHFFLLTSRIFTLTPFYSPLPRQRLSRKLLLSFTANLRVVNAASSFSWFRWKGHVRK